MTWMRSATATAIVAGAVMWIGSAAIGQNAADPNPGSNSNTSAAGNAEPEQDEPKKREPAIRDNAGSKRDNAAENPKGDNAPRPTNAADDAKNVGPGREVNEAIKASGDPGQEKEAVRKAMLEEAKFRNRLAKIKRLRELAEQQGNQERLAALAKLETKMTEIHQRKIAQAKAGLGKDKVRALDDRLDRGRGKGRSAQRVGNPAQIGDPRGAANTDKADDKQAENANAGASKGRPGAPGKSGSGNDGDRGDDGQGKGAGKGGAGAPGAAGGPGTPGSGGNASGRGGAGGKGGSNAGGAAGGRGGKGGSP